MKHIILPRRQNTLLMHKSANVSITNGKDIESIIEVREA